MSMITRKRKREEAFDNKENMPPKNEEASITNQRKKRKLNEATEPIFKELNPFNNEIKVNKNL
jgi:hypothetical protein